MIATKILVNLTQAPYGNSRAKDAIDAVLAASAYEQDLRLLFTGDGVFQLIKQQNGQVIEQKNLAALLSAFPLYDINQIFVQSSALSERGLAENDLALPVTQMKDDEIAVFFEQHDCVLSF